MNGHLFLDCQSLFLQIQAGASKVLERLVFVPFLNGDFWHRGCQSIGGLEKNYGCIRIRTREQRVIKNQYHIHYIADIIFAPLVSTVTKYLLGKTQISCIGSLPLEDETTFGPFLSPWETGKNGYEKTLSCQRYETEELISW